MRGGITRQLGILAAKTLSHHCRHVSHAQLHPTSLSPRAFESVAWHGICRPPKAHTHVHTCTCTQQRVPPTCARSPWVSQLGLSHCLTLAALLFQGLMRPPACLTDADIDIDIDIDTGTESSLPALAPV